MATRLIAAADGRAAYVGEQAEIHQLMLDTDATVFFHGHDHGFVDMEVDGRHYSDPVARGRHGSSKLQRRGMKGVLD